MRGFRLTGISWLVYLWDGGQANFYNDLFDSDSANCMICASNSRGTIANNLFSGGYGEVQPGYFPGSLTNNIFQNARMVALYNAAEYGNPVSYGYNLFWRNAQDYVGFVPAATDVQGDPLLDLESGRLLPGSPAIDAGDPSIIDRNGTRSDIGPFGGPYAY